MKRRLATVLTALIVLAAPLAFIALTPAAAHAATATQAAESSTPAYAHSAQASQNGVTFTVQWDDAPAGEATSFHVTAQGGSGGYKARMDVPAYWDHGSQESVCDPSRGSWTQYSDFAEGGSADFSFEFTASGTYRLYFYFMEPGMSITWLRATVSIDIDDPARPSVTDIVNSAVAQCKQQTDGSEYAMALWLHDWAIDQLDYDRALNWCSAESGLTRHTGTCESYQRIYAKLLDAAGIANGRVEGNGHTWNAVRIDGEWCQADLTWDDSDSTYGDLEQRHLYFGLTDELMAVAHSDHAANYRKEGYAYRSTAPTNDYYVRNGKAREWAGAYAERIQAHLDAGDTEFEIDADNPYDPPSISGIKNGIIAYQMNQMEWKADGRKVGLTAESKVEMTSSTSWTAKYAFKAKYEELNLALNGYFTIQSALDGGSAIDIENGSVEPRANVRLWAPNGTAAQVFRFRYDEASGGYEITNAKSGLALDVAGGAFEARRNIQQYTPNGTEAQRWSVLDNGDGTVTIALKSNNSYVLDAKGGSGSAGTNVQLYGANSTKAQRWRLISPKNEHSFTGYFAIQSALDGGSALDIEGGSLEPRANVRLWRPNDTAAQVFRFRYDEASGGYEITNVKSGLALDVAGGTFAPRQNIQQYTRNGTEAQRWTVLDNGDGTVTIALRSNESYVLDAKGGFGSAGTNVQLYGANSTKAQRWRLIEGK